MDALIGLLILLVAMWLFGDIVLTLLCRVAVVLTSFWVVMHFQNQVARLLMDAGLIHRPSVAQVVTFLVLLGICCRSLRGIAGRVEQGSLSDGETVALDLGRIGLVCAIGLALLITLGSLSSGQLFLLSWMWLLILAVFTTGLDVCCPSLLGRAARLFN